MKRVKNGSLSPEQKQWIKKLEDQGFKVCVCRGHQQAIDAINHYLGVSYGLED
jgi:predicted HAD superfamily phosphohydrolase YqeG